MIFGINSDYFPNIINQIIFVVESHCIFFEVGTDHCSFTYLDELWLQKIKEYGNEPLGSIKDREFLD
jgi:hypothetical protein